MSTTTADARRRTDRPTRSEPRYDFEQFTAVRRYQPTLSFSPDGSEIAYSTNTSGQFNLWRQSSAGGYPHQLTLYSEEAVREVAWSPDGETILFTADRHGDEFHQLYLIPARGGRPEPLTAAPKVQHYLAAEAWSPDGRTLAYAGNDREPTDQDVILRDLHGGEVGRPLAGDASYYAATWSPDGRHFTAIEYHSNSNTDIHLVSLVDGATRNLTAHDGKINYFAGPWAADGSGFYLLTDEGREFLGLAFQDVGTGERARVQTPEWDVDGLAGSADGRLLAWTVNEGGYSRLYARDLASGADLDLPAVPAGVIAALTASRDGSKLGFLLNRPRHPSEVFVLDVAAGTLTQLTHGFLGGIDEAELVEPELVHFPTFDGKQIPGFLYRPRGDGPFPVILSIHGGPEAQEQPRYTGLY